MISAGDFSRGIVEGDIQERSITIGEGAGVNGNVVAETTRVCGQVTGQIKASTVTWIARPRSGGRHQSNQTLAIEPRRLPRGHVRHSDPAGAGR